MRDDTIVQISDPHFGTERPAVVEALVDWVRRQAPSLLVLSGDLTQRARRAQFTAARRFVDRLGVETMLAVPGNHDLPLFNLAARLVDPYRGWRRAFGDETAPLRAGRCWWAVGVRTTRRLRHVDGSVSARQVEQVCDRLATATPAQVRLVVTHQPALTLRPRDARDQLHGADHALRRWSAMGADLVLGGHIHLPYVLPAHDRVRGLARRLWVVQAGTAISHRVRHEAGNSVNLIRVAQRDGQRGCECERWDCPVPGRGFEQVTGAWLALDPVPVPAMA